MAKNTGRKSRVSFGNRTIMGQFLRGRAPVPNIKTGKFAFKKRATTVQSACSAESNEGTVNEEGCLTTQAFIENFAGSMPDFPEIERLEVQERESW